MPRKRLTYDAGTPLDQAKENNAKSQKNNAINQIEDDSNASMLFFTISPIATRETKPEDFQGITIHTAAANGDYEAIRFLLKNGEMVDATDEKNATPLHYAAVNDKLEITKFLLTNGANINSADNDKHTPLHWAALKGSYSMAKFLIENGATVEAINNKNLTPFDYAATFKHADILVLLIKSGGWVKSKDYNIKISPQDAIANKPYLFSISEAVITEKEYILQHKEISANLNRTKELDDLLKKFSTENQVNILRAMFKDIIFPSNERLKKLKVIERSKPQIAIINNIHNNYEHINELNLPVPIWSSIFMSLITTGTAPQTFMLTSHYFFDIVCNMIGSGMTERFAEIPKQLSTSSYAIAQYLVPETIPSIRQDAVYFSRIESKIKSVISDYVISKQRYGYDIGMSELLSDLKTKLLPGNVTVTRNLCSEFTKHLFNVSITGIDDINIEFKLEAKRSIEVLHLKNCLHSTIMQVIDNMIIEQSQQKPALARA